MQIKLSNEYDIQSVFKYLAFALSAMLIWKDTRGAGALLVSLFVFFALTRNKPIEMLFWVLFMTFSSCGNRQFFVTNSMALLAIRGTLLVLAALLSFKAMGSGRAARLMTPFLGVYFYIAWECVSSAQGFAPVVSFLKLFLFVVIFFAMFSVAGAVNRSTQTNAVVLRSAILALLSVVILGSIAVIPFPSLSLMTSKADIDLMLSGAIKSLFQGMTSHSQVMGPFAAVIFTFIFADLVFSIKRFDPFYVLLLLCCPILVYKSSSRTGMGTMLAGVIFISWVALRSRGIGRRWKGRILTTLAVCGIMASVAVVGSSAIRGDALRFLLKWDNTAAAGTSVSVEEVISSRQGLIDVAVRNFKANPFFGNGFQVSEVMRYEKRSSLQEYLSAPIEKGVWIYAIPEEGGVVGMVLFCIWVVVLFKLLIERHAYIGASVFFVFLVSNMGEFSMFSMSYIGGFYWTLTFAAICLDVQRMKQSSMQVFEVPIEVVMDEVGYDEWERSQG